jgi:hypothetical protein
VKSIRKCSEVKWSELQSSAVQCREGKGKEMGKAHMSGGVVRSVRLVLKRECKLCGKIYCKLHTVLSYLLCLLLVHVVS